ncbi:potassium-transporting ATPase subunit KdpC [Paenibacillus sp. MER TA 81-3]|uniref:potassium-transporting ATPase subunit KdpC n=1 Tax=Paenibacillus sp. MER TA 81-3 TaxID=2939573 RepID=UPI00203EB6C0|nr:potassium-transporting ATPase subunit KdpC [Paenibacillus sp. MER TA 81-3]MCM3339568.1 potassium-transporting ATPase subunit KdpC [Paenibacillus sp. MER TA 81-3]
MTNQTTEDVSGSSYLFSIVRIGILFIIMCGFIYPLVSTGLAQLLMPSYAEGSFIKNAEGGIIGSELIGQKFTDPHYFQGRVSSIEYVADASGSNNYGPSNPELVKRVQQSVADWQKSNPDVPVSELPADLITNSGSGLDPHITPDSAEVQIPRISKLTGIPAAELDKIVAQHTEGRSLGLFGEPRVNVLKLNLALDELMKK